MSPRKRSTRSYLVEFALSIVVIVGILVFLTNGGPAFVGPIIAEWFQ